MPAGPRVRLCVCVCACACVVWQRCRIVGPLTSDQTEDARDCKPAQSTENAKLLESTHQGWSTIVGFLILEISSGGFVALPHAWNALPSGTWIDCTPLAPSHSDTPRLLISSPLADEGNGVDADDLMAAARLRRMLLHEPPPAEPPAPKPAKASLAPSEAALSSATPKMSARAVEDALAGVHAEGRKGHVRVGPLLEPLKRPTAAEGTAIEAFKLCANKLAELENQHNSTLAIATQALQKVCGGRASVAQMGVVDGRLLVAVDGAVPEALIEGARAALQQRAAFRRIEQSSPNAEQLHQVTDHDAQAFCATPLYERISLLVRLFFSGRGFAPNRIYTNAMQFADVAHIHRDGNHEGVTALLYPNEAWNPSLSGETMFFAEDEAARHAVLPKPGRLLMFVASIKHCGRPPSRLFWGQRLTLAIKFVAQQPGSANGKSDGVRGPHDLM
jgi:hypothetical protein